MSPDAPPAPAGPGLGPGAGSARWWWPRGRWPLLVALVVVLSALVGAIAAGGADDGERLGPENPGPHGARALVRLLAEHGVAVRTERRSDQATAVTGAASTLLVTSSAALGPAQLDALAADDAGVVVLVEPDEVTLARLAPSLRAAGVVDDDVTDPVCAVPAAVAAGPARAGGHLYGVRPGPRGAVSVCYPGPDSGATGSYVTVRSVDRTVIVVGQSDVLTNERLDGDGNAALALWTLGAQPSLVWYVPDPLEAAADGGQPALIDLLPDWVWWVLAQLGLTALVAIVWRARRLGRLVPEPLPVVVRSAETEEGRARLYLQAGARDRAGATLRSATARRLATRLAAPSGTTGPDLVAILADVTGRSRSPDHVGGPREADRLGALLLGPPPGSDAALVRLADDLDTLEREVSRRDPKDTPQ